MYSQDSQHKYIGIVGTFDGVHIGHQALLLRAQEIASAHQAQLVVITFDKHPAEVLRPDKVPARLSTLPEKLRALHQIVDRVEVLPFTQSFAQLRAEEFLLMLRDEFGIGALILGYDSRLGSDMPQGIEAYRSIAGHLGMEVYSAHLTPVVDEAEGLPISSTRIREYLYSGLPTCFVYHLLGRYYSLEGVVTKGQQIGRTIGYPTANVALEDTSKLVPADGVYAAYVSLPNEQEEGAPEQLYWAMLSVGHRPTIGAGLLRTIEVHILDFSRDIYDQPLRVYFTDYVRPVSRFDGIEELKAQLHQDEATVRLLLAKYGELQ